ncbi:hypothetical protein GOBAR_DD18856 [Gossypium barbadense]|nr:hypothetical protein GOBAR_DD18856 [Gossypium barbadense]
MKFKQDLFPKSFSPSPSKVVKEKSGIWLHLLHRRRILRVRLVSFLRRKCQPECVFAPYFPPDQPQKFVNVHKVFGASNVTKLLNELHPSQREDAVNSLAYEADMRLRDPVYGCVGVISLLQHQLRQLQMDLSCAKSELSKYQSLGITGHAGLIAAAAAATATTHQNLGINLIGSGGGGIGQLSQFQSPRAAAGDDRRTIHPS